MRELQLSARSCLFLVRFMTLTSDKILSYRARFNDKWKIFDYALKLHKQRIENTDSSVQIIDLPLEEDAFDFHMYLFGNVPAATFQEYVNHVHEKTGRPNYLAGWPGVDYK